MKYSTANRIALNFFMEFFSDTKKTTIADGKLYTDNLIFGYSSYKVTYTSDSPIFLEIAPGLISHLVDPGLTVYSPVPWGL